MGLPDTLERVGIVIGSSFLLSLPVGALSILLFGVRGAPSLGFYLSFVPGFLVALLVITGKLPVTHHQIWQFSITSYLLALSAGLFFDPEAIRSNDLFAVGWWLAALAVGAAVARIRFRELLSREPESSTRDS